jgi:probable F420-dependent oxidoreductase
MDLGIALPQFGKHASPEAIVEIAQAAERLGYASVWVQERLLRPLQPITPYAGMVGQPIPEPYRTVYDPIETLTYVAAKTERIKLGTSVIDALFHVPVVLGRRLASLDRLSHGRLIVGLGQGWSEDEFLTANVPPSRRGAGFDEFIAALRAVWGPDPVEFKGRFYQIPKAEINPKPVQPGGPPLLAGAFAPAAIARAARMGVGFNPIGMGWDMLEGMVTSFRDESRAAGHDPSTLPIVVRANIQFTEQPLGADRGQFSGSADQIRADLERAGGLGLNHVFFDLGFGEAPLADYLRLLEQVRPV